MIAVTPKRERKIWGEKERKRERSYWRKEANNGGVLAEVSLANMAGENRERE